MPNFTLVPTNSKVKEVFDRLGQFDWGLNPYEGDSVTRVTKEIITLKSGIKYEG